MGQEFLLNKNSNFVRQREKHYEIQLCTPNLFSSAAPIEEELLIAEGQPDIYPNEELWHPPVDVSQGDFEVPLFRGMVRVAVLSGESAQRLIELEDEEGCTLNLRVLSCDIDTGSTQLTVVPPNRIKH